eukprot:TRINITY_DN16685_c0_g2_i2.p1 TRINITY_DN16685_c0_g2~~TRINITY_DN16685_c0_g2_i2.p1  ORF type:complete len:334 (-),score=28.11 TRINITY_DN16685_c0_g2_i2:3-1004(-)
MGASLTEQCRVKDEGLRVVHFLLLREVVQYGGKGRGQPTRTALENPQESTFILFRINLLREYLELEFDGVDQTMTREHMVERVVDDFVVFCMLTGNDFLPALPTLDISEGALNMIFSVYKDMRPKMGGYIVEDGRIHRQRLEMLISELACSEANVLDQRAADAEYLQNKLNNNKEAFEASNDELDEIDFMEKMMVQLGGSLKEISQKESEPKPVVNEGPTMMSKVARQMFLAGDKSAGLKLWKNRYYKEKLDISSPSQIKDVVQHYLQGLDWVMDYYYRGVTSWDWYYPYHYAPMAQDFNNLTDMPISSSCYPQAYPCCYYSCQSRQEVYGQS